MNYYQYKRRVPENRKSSDYIKPFLLIILFIGILIAGWKLMSAVFGGDEPTVNTTDEKIKVEVESGEAQASTVDEEDWKDITSSLDVYEQEKLKTLSDGRLTLSFFEDSMARLDESTTLKVDALTNNGSSSDIELSLEEGNMWVDTLNSSSLGTNFAVKTDTFTVKSEGAAKFALTAPDSLYVLKGKVEVDIIDGKEAIKTVNVNADQQLVVTDAIVSQISKGLDKEMIFSLDKSFKASDWYKWNLRKDGASSSEDGDAVEDPDKITEEEDQDKKDEDEDNADGPETPQLTKPGENGEEVTLDSVKQVISGTVSEDTEKVVVNDYTLNQYVPGSGKFAYTANANFDNLKVGSNKYSVVAYDKKGNKSKAAVITLVLPKKVFEDAGLKEGDEEDEASTGGVAISSPNGGKNLTTSETNFTISGTVPTKTAVVKVNNYQLQAFAEGQTSFKYNANTTVGTLKKGQKNTYTVEAFDKNGSKLGSASITIDVSGEATVSATDSAPASTGSFSVSISLPTTASAYETTLNEITLGGAVTGSPEAIYVNGKKVESYSSGAEKWSMGVTLNPGVNNFSVYAEKEGQSSSSDTVEVTYKN